MLLRGRSQPLDIGGRFVEIDTTDLDTIDYTAVFAEIVRAPCAENTDFQTVTD